jgi:hypothetical protein
MAEVPCQKIGRGSNELERTRAKSMLMHLFRNKLVALAALLLAISGCLRPPTPFPVAADVNFAAHAESRRLVLDRTRAGSTGIAVPPQLFRRAGAATFVVKLGKDEVAWIWVTGPDGAVVRRTPSADAPLTGEVRSTWDDNAIRLTLHTSDGTVFASDVFVREGGGTGPDRLSRNAQTVLDARGSFRAELRDAAGGSAGWLRVRVSPYQRAPRIYDDVFPPAIDDPLATAAALVLDAEVSWIEDHALDVYRGAPGGGRLEQSFPW